MKMTEQQCIAVVAQIRNHREVMKRWEEKFAGPYLATNVRALYVDPPSDATILQAINSHKLAIHALEAIYLKVKEPEHAKI